MRHDLEIDKYKVERNSSKDEEETEERLQRGFVEWRHDQVDGGQKDQNGDWQRNLTSKNVSYQTIKR